MGITLLTFSMLLMIENPQVFMVNAHAHAHDGHVHAHDRDAQCLMLISDPEVLMAMMLNGEYRPSDIDGQCS